MKSKILPITASGIRPASASMYAGSRRATTVFPEWGRRISWSSKAGSASLTCSRRKPSHSEARRNRSSGVTSGGRVSAGGTNPGAAGLVDWGTGAAAPERRRRRTGRRVLLVIRDLPSTRYRAGSPADQVIGANVVCWSMV